MLFLFFCLRPSRNPNNCQKILSNFKSNLCKHIHNLQKTSAKIVQNLLNLKKKEFEYVLRKFHAQAVSRSRFVLLISVIRLLESVSMKKTELDSASSIPRVRNVMIRNKYITVFLRQINQFINF